MSCVAVDSQLNITSSGTQVIREVTDIFESRLQLAMPNVYTHIAKRLGIRSIRKTVANTDHCDTCEQKGVRLSQGVRQMPTLGESRKIDGRPVDVRRAQNDIDRPPN
jgi:hypothetical protein